jgi:hypothetical protein
MVVRPKAGIPSIPWSPGARLRGRASRCESLQPSLSGPSQRMLTGLNQKRYVVGCPAVYSGHMDAMTTGGKTGPKPRVSFRRNAVNPYRRP